MQAIEHDGTKKMPEVYTPKKLKAHLKDPKVKEVRVFRLNKGMSINIEGDLYKVIAIRPNGKLTLKYIRQLA